MSDSRERFEAWCESEGINASRLASGTYTHPSARVVWRGWQAAERQALERALAISEANDDGTGYASSSTEQIRALLKDEENKDA